MYVKPPMIDTYPWAIVHDRAELVGDVQRRNIPVFRELVLEHSDVLVKNLHRVVAISPLLFMPQTQDMADLMHWPPELQTNKT